MYLLLKEGIKVSVPESDSLVAGVAAPFESWLLSQAALMESFKVSTPKVIPPNDPPSPEILNEMPLYAEASTVVQLSKYRPNPE